jgi:hypothetical protein
VDLAEMIVVHACWFDEAERALLAERGGSLAYCPGSNMFLGDGVTDLVDLHARGVRVGLGTDGGCSNNRVSVLDEMRTAALLQKVHRIDGQAITAEACFAMGTRGGGEVLRLPVGRVAPGYRCDPGRRRPRGPLAVAGPGPRKEPGLRAVASRHHRCRGRCRGRGHRAASDPGTPGRDWKTCPRPSPATGAVTESISGCRRGRGPGRWLRQGAFAPRRAPRDRPRAHALAPRRLGGLRAGRRRAAGLEARRRRPGPRRDLADHRRAVAAWAFARTVIFAPGTIIVDGSQVVLPRGLCRSKPATFARDRVEHVYLLRRAVPWTRAAPVLVIEADGKAFSYPRDWFASEADQRRVIRALHGTARGYAVSSEARAKRA